MPSVYLLLDLHPDLDADLDLDLDSTPSQYGCTTPGGSLYDFPFHVLQGESMKTRELVPLDLAVVPAQIPGPKLY